MKARKTILSGSFFILCILLLCCFSSSVSSHQSFSSPNVPINDPAYRQIDKLIAFGLIKDAIFGQRPWSRNEMARMIDEAARRLEEREAPLTPDSRDLVPGIAALEILDRLRLDFREELARRNGKPGNLRIHLLERFSLGYTLLDSPPRDIPQDNGIGRIDAYINPLVANQNGLDFTDGNNLWLESTHSALLSKYFSLSFTPHLRLLVPNTGSVKPQFLVQNLYGKATVSNVELEAGRDHLIWGQGDRGGLLFSNNARALDMVKISNDSPFYHPWIFKYFGPSKYTFFVANLGPERIFSNAFLYGLKVSIKPASFLELGFSETIIIGGDGAPSLSFFDPIAELFPVHKIGRNVLFQDKSDHRFGFFDMRLTIPPLRNSVLYYEAFFDDSPARAIGHFSDIGDQMAMVVGFYIPHLTVDGTADMTLEYRHIPGVAYRHNRWISGYTLNRELIGDSLGPDGDAVTVRTAFDLQPQRTLAFSFAYENRDSDFFTQSFNPVTDGGEEFIRAQNNPAEHRLRAGSDLSWQITKLLRLHSEAHYEHVFNFNFTRGRDQNNFLFSLNFLFTPPHSHEAKIGF